MQLALDAPPSDPDSSLGALAVERLAPALNGWLLMLEKGQRGQGPTRNDCCPVVAVSQLRVRVVIRRPGRRSRLSRPKSVPAEQPPAVVAAAARG